MQILVRSDERMICDTCRLSIGHIHTMDDYVEVCSVADDPIARLDGSIGTEGCAWYLPEVREWTQ